MASSNLLPGQCNQFMPAQTSTLTDVNQSLNDHRKSFLAEDTYWRLPTRHNFHYLTVWTLAGDVPRSSLFKSWLDILGHLSMTCRGRYKYGNPGADVNNTAALKRASLKILAVWGRNTYRYSYRQFYPCLAFHRWSAQQRWRCESWDDLWTLERAQVVPKDARKSRGGVTWRSS